MLADFGEKTVSACLRYCMSLSECLYASFIAGSKTSGGHCWIFSKACSDPPNTKKKWMEGGLSFKKVEPCGESSNGNVCRPKLPTAETQALVAETCACATLSDAPSSCNAVAHCVHTAEKMLPLGPGICAGSGHGYQADESIIESMDTELGENAVAACLSHCISSKKCLFASYHDFKGGSCRMYSKACSDPPDTTQKKWYAGVTSFAKMQACGEDRGNVHVCRPTRPTADTDVVGALGAMVAAIDMYLYAITPKSNFLVANFSLHNWFSRSIF